EDKPALFDAFDTVQAAVDLAAPLVEGAELNRSSIAARLERGHLDATTLMEHLIQRGLPQRTAHHLVGKLVAVANEHEITLAELSLEQLQGVHPDLDESLKNALGVAQAVKAYQSYGSSNPERVSEQVHRWTTRLQ
ncbi:MAG: argininosuccinate lyase, partial [Aureliella sp.]